LVGSKAPTNTRRLILETAQALVARTGPQGLRLQDIAAEELTVIGLPLPPLGTEIGRVEVIVRVHPGNR